MSGLYKNYYRTIITDLVAAQKPHLSRAVEPYRVEVMKPRVQRGMYVVARASPLYTILRVINTVRRPTQ